MADLAAQKPGSPFITPLRLRELYGMMLRLREAAPATQLLFAKKKWPKKCLPAVGHPAVLAGCFSHLRAGDIVAPSACAFAANLAAGAPTTDLLRILHAQATTVSGKALGTAEAAAVIAGAAQAQLVLGRHGVVTCFLDENIVTDSSLDGVWRHCVAKRLPLLVLTVSRRAPEASDIDTRAAKALGGMAQIAVGADDAPAIYRVMQESIHRARTGIGPTWIRCVETRGDALQAMQTFLETRGHFDPHQPRSERAAWATEWKAACKPSFLNALANEPFTPRVRGFDPFR